MRIENAAIYLAVISLFVWWQLKGGALQ